MLLFFSGVVIGGVGAVIFLYTLDLINKITSGYEFEESK